MDVMEIINFRDELPNSRQARITPREHVCIRGQFVRGGGASYPANLVAVARVSASVVTKILKLLGETRTVCHKTKS